MACCAAEAATDGFGGDGTFEGELIGPLVVDDRRDDGHWIDEVDVVVAKLRLLPEPIALRRVGGSIACYGGGLVKCVE